MNDNLLGRSIKDFLSPKMLKFAIMPFIVTMLLFYVLLFTLLGLGFDSLGSMDVHSTQTTIQNGVPHTDSFQATLQGSAIIKFLMSHTLTAWLATFLVYVIGGFFTFFASIFVAIVIIGFLTPFILKELHKKHYSYLEMKGHSNIFAGILLIIKYSLIMLLLFLVLAPLHFIPLINVITLNIPLYYFFYKAIHYDISTEICDEEENAIIRSKHAFELHLKTIGLYLLSMVPFAVIFGAVFYVIYLGNTYFERVKALRA